jgi:hypothetical protein
VRDLFDNDLGLSDTVIHVHVPVPQDTRETKTVHRNATTGLIESVTSFSEGIRP